MVDGGHPPRQPSVGGQGHWPLDGQGRAQSPTPTGAMGGRHGGGARPLTPLPPPPALPSAISSILGTWLDQYSEDFCQPPGFPCLKQLVAYVQLNMPGSDLERRAHLLLAQLERTEHTELTEAELEGEEKGRPWAVQGWTQEPPGAGVGLAGSKDWPRATHRDCGWGSVLG